MMNIRLQKRTYRASGWAGRFVAGVDSRRIRRASFFTIIVGWLFLSASPKAFSQNEEGAESKLLRIAKIAKGQDHGSKS
jgi:hypothetical protein